MLWSTTYILISKSRHGPLLMQIIVHSLKSLATFDVQIVDPKIAVESEILAHFI